MLPHERLDVFWLADEYVAFIDYILPRIKSFSKADGNQLDREAGSLILNLIEAAAETSPGDKVRYFRYSRREVNESFGVFWRHHRKQHITDAELAVSRYYTDRLSGMIWGLMKKWEK
jgi:four helix bundle protein